MKEVTKVEIEEINLCSSSSPPPVLLSSPSPAIFTWAMIITLIIIGAIMGTLIENDKNTLQAAKRVIQWTLFYLNIIFKPILLWISKQFRIFSNTFASYFWSNGMGTEERGKYGQERKDPQSDMYHSVLSISIHEGSRREEYMKDEDEQMDGLDPEAVGIVQLRSRQPTILRRPYEEAKRFPPVEDSMDSISLPSLFEPHSAERNHFLIANTINDNKFPSEI